MMYLVRTTHHTTPGARAESDIQDPCSTKDSDGELVELKEVASGGRMEGTNVNILSKQVAVFRRTNGEKNYVDSR